MRTVIVWLDERFMHSCVSHVTDGFCQLMALLSKLIFSYLVLDHLSHDSS